MPDWIMIKTVGTLHPKGCGFLPTVFSMPETSLYPQAEAYSFRLVSQHKKDRYLSKISQKAQEQ